VEASPQGIVTIHPSSFAASLPYLSTLHPPHLLPPSPSPFLAHTRQVEASPQGIVSIDPSSFLSSDDGSRYSVTATLPPATSSSSSSSTGGSANDSTDSSNSTSSGDSSSSSSSASGAAVTVALRPGSCADSSGRAWRAGFESYAVIRIDRAPLEATLSCDTPLAVVKFFMQLRATPRVSQSPVTCRVLFSKPVSSFSSSSLAVVNATTSDPQPVTDLEYQFQVWPTGEGSVVVDIRHDNVTDAAGNTCQPTQPFFFFFGQSCLPSTHPACPTLSCALHVTLFFFPPASPRSPPQSALPPTAACSPPHRSLLSPPPQSALSICRTFCCCIFSNFHNCPAQAQPLTFYLVVNAPSIHFCIHILALRHPPSIPPALPPSSPSPLTLDTTAPAVQLSVSESSATTDWVYPILVAFSEPVLGFNTSSIQLSNGVITCWTGVDRGLGRYYEVTVAAVSDGDVTVAVPAATVVDMAGNPNSPSNTLSLAHCGSTLSHTHNGLTLSYLVEPKVNSGGYCMQPQLALQHTLPLSQNVRTHPPSLTVCANTLSLSHSGLNTLSLLRCGVALSLPHSLWGSALPPSLTVG
ncbi:unnamed protein product, partial [Closterium sp. NIES-54]